MRPNTASRSMPLSARLGSGGGSAANARQISVDHHLHERAEVYVGRPSERAFAFEASPMSDRLLPAGETAGPGERISASRARRARRRSPRARAPNGSRRWQSRSRRPSSAAASSTSRGRSRRRNPSRACASRLPRPSVSARPSLMRATPSVTLRVTNSRPRRGDSWLKRMPETAKRS